MGGRWWWRLLVTVGSVALVWAGWTFLAPSQLGGRVTYTITSGSSMMPAVDAGDLVVVRRAPRYQTGDVVAYRSASGATVLHRIIGQEGSRFVVQGDHNSWVDPDLPSAAEVLGRMKHRIPHAGWIVEWLRRPLPTSLLVGAVSFLVGWRHQRRRGWIVPAGSGTALALAVVAVIVWQPIPAGAKAATVAVTTLGVETRPITPNDLKPDACAGIAVQVLVTGSGTLQGSPNRDLILGGPKGDTLRGVGEKDCLVGGSGNDTLNGGADQDVCVGGPGTDTFTNCESALQ